MKTRRRQTLAEAIAHANELGYPYAVQEWRSADGGPSDYVVAHGSMDGIGLTVYATIRHSIPPDDYDPFGSVECGFTGYNE